MSNEVILNLSFDNQTVTDLTGNWILDGTPNATYGQIDGRDGYSIITGSLGRCIVLNAVDQNVVYNEYTVDFDMFVKPTYTSDYYIYDVYYLWSLINPGNEYSGTIGDVLDICLEIGGSEQVGTTNYSPIGRWVHVTFTSGPTGVDDQYCTTVYVDGVKLIDRTEDTYEGGANPFALSQQIIPLARDTDNKLMPNGPGICLNTFKVVTGIHVPDQNPAISLLNLRRSFNNFCTWLKRQLSTVAFTGSYNDLSNKPTISTVNDGTLTIQQNGTNVQTFTANASTNKTANIQCVDLSTAQTIGGVKTFTSNMVIQGSKRVTCTLDNSFIELDGGTTWGKGGSIVLSGQDRGSYTNSVLIVSKSDTNTDILQYQNGELKPLSNNTNNSSLGTSTNQWKSVYSQTYYYNGTAWGLDKVNEWTDTNTFSKTNSDTIQLKNSRVAIGETISSDAYTQLVFKDKNTDNLAYIRDNYIANGTNNLDFYVRNKYSSGSPSTTGSVVYTYFGLSLDNTGKSYARLKGDFYPYTDNLYSLGTSTNKWSKVYSDDVVHTTGNETISGIKAFTNNPYIKCSSPFLSIVSTGYTKGVTPSSNMFQGIRFYDDETSSSENHIVGGFESQYSTSGYNSFNINCRNYNQNNIQLNYTLGLYVPNDNTRPIQFVPSANNVINMGAPSYQWNNIYTRNILIDNDINIASSLINKTSNSGVLAMRGGISDTEGASINLYGKDYGGSPGLVGNIYMTAYGSSDYTNFRIYPNGIIRVYNNSTATTKNVAMQEDVIPRSGGAVITDYFLGRSGNTESLMISGGTSWSSGGSLETFGSSHSSYAGRVRLQPALSDSNFKTMNLEPSGTWSWSGTACQITSDQRLKQQITEIDDKLLDAWEDVDLVQFKYNDAVDQKGKDKARLHTGYVVQQIDEACKSHNVDISDYGLYCHEVYQEETREVEHEDGTKTIEVVRPASEHYSLRYTEALIVECAYLRKCIKELRNEIEQLKSSK